eukprot:gene16298-18471_t
MLNLLIVLTTVLAVTCATTPKSVEEAYKIIQDHVKSFGTGISGGLCDKNKCCIISSTESCPISKMTKDSSTLVLPGGNTRCIFSDSTPFAFQVVPGDSDICTTDSSPQSLVGLFDRTDTKNKYRSFTIVHVSYCSGDLFGGNVTRSYNDKKGQPVVQVGLFNAQSAVDWIKQQMKNGGLASQLSEFVVSGCSAGSIGAQLWGNEATKQINWKHAAVIPDSFAGVFPDGSSGPLIYNFGFCSSGFLSTEFYQRCINQQLELYDIVMEYIAENPSIPYNFIQSKIDIVQHSIYTAVAVSTDTKPIILTSEEFYKRVNTIFGLYNQGDLTRQANPNFVTYLVD